MTYEIAKFMAEHRLFWFFLKVYFPEYAERDIRASEHPFHMERLDASLRLGAFIEKGPIAIRFAVILDELDRRECAYLCGTKRPALIREETDSIMRELELSIRRWRKNRNEWINAQTARGLI